MRRTFRGALVLLAAGAITTASMANAWSATPGTKLWKRTFSTAGFRDTAVGPDGQRVFVTGSVGGDFATVGYDAATGTKLWSSTYDGPDHLGDFASQVAVSPDGSRVFVSGYSSQTGTYAANYSTVAYDAGTGQQLWAATYDGPGGSFCDHFDIAYALGVSPDGTRVFVTGGSCSKAAYEDAVTIAYRAGTGAPVWVNRYKGADARDNFGYALAVSPNGSAVFITGEDTGLGQPTIAIDAKTGSQLWQREVSNLVGRALVVNAGGTRVFVAGGNVVAYNASTGAKAWGTPASSTDAWNAIAIDPAGGRLYVTGSGYDSVAGESRFLTVARNTSDGSEAWTKTYDGPGTGDDWGGNAVDATSTHVYVTGGSLGVTTDQDYTTISYDAATGAQAWLKRADITGFQDLANGIALSPDGTAVFVTGGSGATFAYAA